MGNRGFFSGFGGDDVEIGKVYVPTFTLSTNVASIGTPGRWIWQRVKNVLYISGIGSLWASTSAGTQSTLYMSLPIPYICPANQFIFGTIGVPSPSGGGRAIGRTGFSQLQLQWVPEITAGINPTVVVMMLLSYDGA